METLKYTPEEILEILNAFYGFQAMFDPEVEYVTALTFETTISEWQDICDLIPSKPLANVYQDEFKLDTPPIHLENILSEDNTLGDFCNYLSENAIKQSVKPIRLLGQDCMTASLFLALMNNLKFRGVDVTDIKPSSKFRPLFHKYGNEIISEVNKLAPGTLFRIEFENNSFVKAGWRILGLALLSTIISSIVWHFDWILLLPSLAGVFLVVIGKQFKPATDVYGGYETLRDLVIQMHTKILDKT